MRLCKNVDVVAMLDADNLRTLLQGVTQIAVSAGNAILEVYEDPAFDVSLKSDRSPLTQADLRAHHCIAEGLGRISDLPMLSEEGAGVPFETRRGWERYWLVDPLDGTREFVARNGEFTVNIALIDRHVPVLGVVYAPVKQLLYAGGTGCVPSGAKGSGMSAVPVVPAFRRQGTALPSPLGTSVPPRHPTRVVASRSHLDAATQSYLERLGPTVQVSIGSSLKFCQVAEGEADVYPRLSPTSEWDTAAGHAVLAAAGGGVIRLDGTPLRYNTRAELTNPAFIAFGDPGGDWLAPLR